MDISIDIYFHRKLFKSIEAKEFNSVIESNGSLSRLLKETTDGSPKKFVELASQDDITKFAKDFAESKAWKDIVSTYENDCDDITEVYEGLTIESFLAWWNLYGNRVVAAKIGNKVLIMHALTYSEKQPIHYTLMSGKDFSKWLETYDLETPGEYIKDLIKVAKNITDHICDMQAKYALGRLSPTEKEEYLANLDDFDEFKANGTDRAEKLYEAYVSFMKSRMPKV